MSGRMLRPEARPLDLEELSLSQLETIDRVVSSMKEAYDQISSPEESAPKLDQLDPKRSSRLYFVSGEPGIGKTTIYTTLRKLLSADSRAQKKNKDKLDAFRRNMAKRKKLKQNIRSNSLTLAGGVRWLEPLDLEPLSGSTNFLAAVMVRIERALDSGREPKSRASARGLLDRPSETREALVELNRFQNELAMSWDGNLQARAAHVEPDQYATEVLRAERARLSVNQRLQDILSKLVPPGEEQRRKPPLFLLVIDDIYLNPASSIELLRLLRMISSPQLFVLLLGDYDLLEYLFCQQTLGDYIKLAGDAALKMFEVDFREELQSRAWALAAGSLRKLLPPKQKTDLSTLWINEALGFRALDARENGESAQLKDLLEKLRIRQGSFPSNVKELITSGWRARQGDTKRDWGRHVYSGALLLEMPPRHATDLWMKLDDNEKQWNNDKKKKKKKPLPTDDTIKKPKPKPKPLPTDDTINLLGDEFRFALDEQNRVDGLQRSKLEQAVTRGNAHDPFENYKIHTKRLSIKIVKTKKSKTEASNVRGSITGTTRMDAPEHVEWSVQLRDNADEKKSNPSKPKPKNKSNPSKPKPKEKILDLPPRPLGWLVVLHDVLVLGRPKNALGGPLVHGSKHLRWVSFSWKINGIGDGEPQDSDTLYWPAPEWSTFLEIDLLKWAWNNLATESDGQTIHSEVKAFRWLDAICSILSKTMYLEHFANPSAQPNDSLWEKLVKRISNLASSTEGEASKITLDWVVDVGIVVALRLGISEKVAELFEQDGTLLEFWRNAPEIKEMRNNAPGKRRFHADAAKYFPEAWPPVIAKGAA